MNKNSKIHNIMKSTFAGILNNLCLIVLNLISRKLFLNYIGIEYLSVAQIISNILVILSFSELGLSNAVLYMLYKPVAQNDENTIKRIVIMYSKFNKVIGCVIAVLGTVMMPMIHFFITTSIPNRIVYLIYLLNLYSSVSTYFYTYRSALLSANQKDYIASIISVITSFVRIILQCCVIYFTKNYIVYLLTTIIASIIQNGIVYYYVGKLYPFIKNNKGVVIDENERKQLLNNIKAFVSVKIAAIVINNTDNILVSWLDTIMVGMCSNYISISGQLKSLIGIFQNSVFHSIGIANAEQNDKKKIYILFKKVMLVNTFIVGLSATCLGVLWNDFIVMWIGEKYLVNNLIFASLLLNFTWGLIISPIWMFRDANGLFIYVKKMLLLNAMLNILLSIILGKTIGVSGVYFATIISDLITDFWYDSKLIYTKVFEKKNSIKYQIYVIENVIAITALIFLINFITSSFSKGIILWLCKAMICVLLYTMYFVIRNIGSNEFREIINMVKNRIVYR